MCVSCDNCYLVIDIVSGSIQKLFDFDIENFTPFIANYDEGEFLLNCLGNLGMFSSFDGQSTRPPIPWNSNCTQFQICNPYILCVSEKNVIEVYSMIDQKLKQEIGLVQMRSIKYINEENFFIVSTPTQICALNVTSRSIQIDQLLKEQQLEQAVSLFKILYSNLGQQKYEMEYRKLQVKIAFIELMEKRNTANALEDFLEAYPDFRCVSVPSSPRPGLLWKLEFWFLLYSRLPSWYRTLPSQSRSPMSPTTPIRTGSNSSKLP